jgi:hypothetical protein
MWKRSTQPLSLKSDMVWRMRAASWNISLRIFLCKAKSWSLFFLARQAGSAGLGGVVGLLQVRLSWLRRAVLVFVISILVFVISVSIGFFIVLALALIILDLDACEDVFSFVLICQDDAHVFRIPEVQ